MQILDSIDQRLGPWASKLVASCIVITAVIAPLAPVLAALHQALIMFQEDKDTLTHWAGWGFQLFVFIAFISLAFFVADRWLRKRRENWWNDAEEKMDARQREVQKLADEVRQCLDQAKR